jgi:hypothetical protein
MRKVLLVTATSRGDALTAIGRALEPMYAEQGYILEVVDLNRPDVSSYLGTELNSGNVTFVLSNAGLLCDSTLQNQPGGPVNLWEATKIPLLSLLSDSPAYFFDRHVVQGPSTALIYGFPDHLMMRKRLPLLRGAIGSPPPCILNDVPFDEVDFATKAKGQVFFLKNGNDPRKLVQQWHDTLQPTVAQALTELGELLTTEHIDNCGGTLIDDAITLYFADRGIDIEHLTRMRLLCLGHLDDYVRRVKSTMMAEALMDFPVVIHGDNWEHLDFTGKHCTFISGVDYERSRLLVRDSLGMIDMSPNTSYGPHDRLVRSYGAHTLCVSNEQNFLTDTFPDQHAQMTFRFNKDSIRERVSQMLENPVKTLELGAQAAMTFRQRYSTANHVRYMAMMAETVRQSSGTRARGQQDFLNWPPTVI